MQFLYPQFLLALFALAIPIIIHLFYFRRFKKVYFSNVKFLKELKEESSARQRLKNLLVLSMRLLAFAALILAFTQPFFTTDGTVKKGEKAVSIFLDNSFSMKALSEDVPLFEKAKQRAREIVNAYKVDDRFQILTNDFEGKHQRLVGKEDALSLIEELRISPVVKDLSKVLARQKQALLTAQSKNLDSYILSDFQKNIVDLDTYQDTTIDLNLIPLQSVQEKNISLDSAWFDSPVQMVNQTNTLLVRVKNNSNRAVENIRLTIQQDGQVKPIGTLSIPAQSSVVDSVNLTVLRPGWQTAELSITDYPIQFDDTYYFTYHVAKEIKVLNIYEGSPNKYLAAAFKGGSTFQLTSQPANKIDYASLSNYHLVVLQNLPSIASGLASELAQYTKNGGNVLVFPNANTNIAAYRSFLSNFQANELTSYEQLERKVATINTDAFVFKEVFEKISQNIKLPVTQANFKITNYGSKKEVRLLTYRDGSTFLGQYRLDKGYLFLCTAPLDNELNDLVKSGEIFIPMLYKMAIISAKDQQIAYTIGKDAVTETDNRITEAEMVYKLKGPKEEFIPQQKTIGNKVILGMNQQIKQAGFYDLYLDPANILAKYGFNFDRKESELTYLNTSDLTARLGAKVKIIESKDMASLTPLIGEQSQGTAYWRWCLIAALIFLLLETLLLRFWKG